MKTLTEQQVNTLARLVALTREKEFDCSQCQAHLSEFAEHEPSGQCASEVLACVEHHLTVCPECREDYEALLLVLNAPT